MLRHGIELNADGTVSKLDGAVGGHLLALVIALRSMYLDFVYSSKSVVAVGLRFKFGTVVTDTVADVQMPLVSFNWIDILKHCQSCPHKNFFDFIESELCFVKHDTEFTRRTE